MREHQDLERMQLSHYLFTYEDNDLNRIDPHALNLRQNQRFSMPNPTEQMLRLPLLRGPGAL